METSAHDVGPIRQGCLAGGGLNHYSRLAQFLFKTSEEIVMARHKKGREHRVVVVPAPTLAKQVGTLHGAVGKNASAYGVYTHRLYPVEKGLEVVGIETRVETANAIDVAR